MKSLLAVLSVLALPQYGFSLPILVPAAGVSPLTADMYKVDLAPEIKTDTLQNIPLYPLPPIPAGEMPPVMPFATDAPKVGLMSAGPVPPVKMVVADQLPAAAPSFMESGARVERRGDRVQQRNREQAFGANAVDGSMAFGAMANPDTSLLGLNVPFAEPPLAGVLAANAGNPLAKYFLRPRRDSVNPYCDTCILAMAALNADMAKAEADICALVPSVKRESCLSVVKGLKANADVKSLVESGCVDKTGPMALVKEAKKCPGLAACNAIESEGGGPMCGVTLRGWGDFSAEESLKRPLRPEAWNAFPMQPAVAPPPGVYVYGDGNVYCDVCVEAMNVLNVDPKKDAAGICESAPDRYSGRCQAFAPVLLENTVAKDILAKGCIDKTAIGAVMTGAGKCPGELACNIIQDQIGGPICGAVLRSIGDMEPAAAK